MSNCRVLAGEKHNLLELANSITTSAADSLYPSANLYDGRPSKPFRFATPAAADVMVTLDLDRLAGKGGFESFPGGVPDGFTVAVTGAGTVTQDTVVKNSGASSVKLTSAVGGSASAYKDITARAGEWAKIEWALRGDATATARLRVQNPQTGKYLKPDGTWDAAVTDLATQLAASWATNSLTFQVESFATCLVDTVTLRVTVLNNTSSANDAWADDVYLYPGVDLLSIHGHNIAPAVVVTLRSSTDNFSASDTVEGTAVLTQPTFYVLLVARVYRRYWRVKFAGTNVGAAIEIGELVLGQTLTLARNPDFGYEIAWVDTDVASETESGEQHVTIRGRQPRRVFALRFRLISEAVFVEARDEVFRRSRGRARPLVIVPDTDKADVLHGRIDRRWRAIRQFLSYYTDNDLVVSESPFPTSVS